MALYLDVVFNLPVEGAFTYSLPDDLSCTEGMRVQAPFRSRELRGVVISVHSDKPEADFAIKPITKVLDTEPLADKEYLRLGEWMAGMYMCTLGEALSAMLPAGKREKDTGFIDSYGQDEAENIILAPQQKEALEKIFSKPPGITYLYGVTGSGKTEVYLRAAQKILDSGKGVIYCVPEISLTHQIIASVKHRFGSSVAVLHSSLTPSERLAHWKRLFRGEAKIAVGARSAVFAPIRDLGLIIIDEEHESSYKSGRTPRYHARQVAMKRGSLSHAHVIMGSATPSAEAYYLMGKGTIHGIELPERLSGGLLPEISIVDMKKEKAPFSKLLIREIEKTAAEGRQTILFLNRRGFSYFFHCRSCGYEMTCGSCSVSLTYHRDKNRMICHYCGYSTDPISVCPSCGSLDVGYGGFGTEKIEEEMNALFPRLRIERLDTDSAGKKGTMKKTLDSFRKGEIDVLLGTQMVAKGLNFPGAKLVGIILADTGLQLPDFRASERAFSLMVQVAGRAGRYMPDGKVIVQTYRPGNPAVIFAAKHDIKGFFNYEFETRRLLAFPPFTRLFRIVFRGRKKGNVSRSASLFAENLQAELGKAAAILGPAECPISMIAKNYRFHIIIRTTEFQLIHRKIAGILKLRDVPPGVYREIDIDPVSIM